MKDILTEAKQWLTETGLPWSIVDGGKHNKLFIGSQLVGVIPKCDRRTSDTRSRLNIRAQIRRAAKGLKP